MITIVQSVTTYNGDVGYVVYLGVASYGDARDARFIRQDAFTPPLKAILGRYVMLRPLPIVAPAFHQLCRMPGVADVDR
jgi:hypothetical protein